MTPGPEIWRIIEEFEDQTCMDYDDDDIESLQHQEALGAQVTFQKQVQNIVAVIKAKGTSLS